MHDSRRSWDRSLVGFGLRMGKLMLIGQSFEGLSCADLLRAAPTSFPHKVDTKRELRKPHYVWAVIHEHNPLAKKKRSLIFE